ncbi:MAG TPA: hypothetical protein VIQ00_02725 [Chitinophagaceae bacterium]|jgi:hypothetical protein
MKYLRRFFPLLLLALFSLQSLKAQQNGNDDVIDTFIVDADTLLAGEKQPEYFLKIDSGDVVAAAVQLRHVPDSIVSSLKKDDAFWYADGKKEKPKTVQPTAQQDEPFLLWLVQQQWFRVLIWIIIIGGFIAVIIWYLIESNIGIFSKPSKKIASSGMDPITESIFDIDYSTEINNAIHSFNYRLATRLLFLRLLKNMSENNVIQYKQQRTNFDYLVQLQQTNYYNEFFRLTRNYEYAWYGKFDVSKEAFNAIRNDFEKFEQKIKN